MHARLPATAGVTGLLVLTLALTPAEPADAALPPPSSVRVPADAHFVSPRGSNRNPGSRSRPWRSIEKALSRARPGDTIVVRAGFYGARGRTLSVRARGTTHQPISIVGDPRGTLPRIRGHVKITGSHLRLSGLLFDGPSGRVQRVSRRNPKGEQVLVAVNGTDVTIARSVIRKSAWHAGIFVSGAKRAQIVGNHIYSNGDRSEPSQANNDHGIYWSSGWGLVANNVIDGNVARGVQLYPDAAGVIVAHNVVVNNGRAGVQIGDDSTNNVVVNNIVAFNGASGIRSADLDGSGNRVLNNLVWGNADANIGPEIEGLTIRGTFEEDPRFSGRGDYCPTSGSPAVDWALPEYAVRTDYFGTVRAMHGPPDIGACELAR